MGSLENRTLAELKSLDLPNRLAAIDELWETVVAEQGKIPLADPERRLLDFAAEGLRKHPDSAVEWSEFKERLINSLRS